VVLLGLADEARGLVVIVDDVGDAVEIRGEQVVYGHDAYAVQADHRRGTDAGQLADPFVLGHEVGPPGCERRPFARWA
jgi:hypothetical protein